MIYKALPPITHAATLSSIYYYIQHDICDILANASFGAVVMANLLGRDRRSGSTSQIQGSDCHEIKQSSLALSENQKTSRLNKIGVHGRFDESDAIILAIYPMIFGYFWSNSIHSGHDANEKLRFVIFRPSAYLDATLLTRNKKGFY